MVLLAGLLLLTFLLRAGRLDQPIVENYVGRQVPTAMVARNLERGSGFLRPELDTAPFPNLFLVEPPLYAMACGYVQGVARLSLGQAGRLVSAFAIALVAGDFTDWSVAAKGPAPRCCRWRPSRACR